MGAAAEAVVSVAEVGVVATAGTGMMTVGVAAVAMEVAVVAMEVVAVAATTTAAGAVVTTRMAVVIADTTIEGNYRGYRARCVVVCKLR